MCDTGLKILGSGQELDIENYKMIFDIFIQEYTKYYQEWLDSICHKINLRRKCVCDIYLDDCSFENNFKDYLDSYLEGIYELALIIVERVNSECNLFIRWRVKDYTSIIYKVYQKNKELNGGFPINKCINDLLAFRIVDINYNSNIGKVKEHLECFEKSKHRIRHMDSSKNGYKGYHIYFYGFNNYCFPIEIQIWNYEDERNNLELHNIYKQEYINWLDEYKKI